MFDDEITQEYLIPPFDREPTRRYKVPGKCPCCDGEGQIPKEMEWGGYMLVSCKMCNGNGRLS